MIVIFQLKSHDHLKKYHDKYDQYFSCDAWFEFVFCDAVSIKKNFEENIVDDELLFLLEFERWCRKTTYTNYFLKFNETNEITKHFRWKFETNRKFLQNLRNDNLFALLTNVYFDYNCHVKKASINIKQMNDVMTHQIEFQMIC